LSSEIKILEGQTLIPKIAPTFTNELPLLALYVCLY